MSGLLFLMDVDALFQSVKPAPNNGSDLLIVLKSVVSSMNDGQEDLFLLILTVKRSESVP